MMGSHSFGSLKQLLKRQQRQGAMDACAHPTLALELCLPQGNFILEVEGRSEGPLPSVHFHKPLAHIGQIRIFRGDTFRTTQDKLSLKT